MTRALPWMLLATAAVLAGPAADGKPATGGANSDCSAIRILADGRQIPAAIPPGLSVNSGVRQGRGSAAAWASSRAVGRRGAASSSSSSSATSSEGGSFARTSSSYTDESGRTVTITRDGRGCKVTIDDRTTGEE